MGWILEYGTVKLNPLKSVLAGNGNLKCSIPLGQINHLFLSIQISIRNVCPDLTNWHDNISSKNNKEEYYECQTDETKTNDGGPT